MRQLLNSRRGTLAIATTLLALTTAQAAAVLPAVAAPAPNNTTAATAPNSTSSAVTDAKEQAARAIASSLSDAAWSTRLSRAVQAGDVAVSTLAEGALRTKLAELDQRILTAKGLNTGIGSLLQLRLGADSMRAALVAGATPWVVAAGSQESGTATAYDSTGGTHTVNVNAPPSRPVYVIDIDGAKALAAGVNVLDNQFSNQGLAPRAKRTAAPFAAAAGIRTTRIKQVRLAYDEEPWIKGAAEIYALTTGYGKDGKVRVDAVDMPYLDWDQTDYFPNQILVNWSLYKYDTADVVMMEDDDDTNYRDLAKAIVTALLTIVDHGAFAPLANAVLDAIPDYWWKDDDDYVDSWYSLTTKTNGKLTGAAGNGTMTLEPYFVNQLP